MKDNSNKEQNKIIDKRFNIMSYEQYLIDLEEKKFNKMSMTEVVNADMTIATFGEEQYNRTCQEILESGNAAYVQLGLDQIIYVYSNTYKHFMAVANDDISDEDFLNLMKGFHEQYELIRAEQTELGGISRFAIVFGDNLVDRAKSAYYMNKDLQNNFFVVTDEKETLAAERKENVKLFELLMYVIENKKVVPYYQGVYDNKTKKIEKYEALMRIYDKNNNMHTPGTFLEGAKTLKLYLSLSKIMIDKVLDDFADKESEVSINISLLEIQTQDFKTWLIDRIKRHPKADKLTIEFVETEDYNGNKEVEAFLMEVKNAGCKIAIDDFGVGFATYNSIVSLKPDAIKVDGEIIKNLATDVQSETILDAICYLAKLIDADVVAEFVENEKIQNLVIEHNAEFSQGYHFAKPEPIEKLNIK